MRLYRVEFHAAHAGRLLAWEPNKRAAEARLRALRQEHGEPQGPAGVEAIEFPTDKTGVLAWLNRHFDTDNG